MQPKYLYLPGTDLRVLRPQGHWATARIVHAHTGAEAAPNTYIIGGVDGAPREAIELSRLNHAPLLDQTIDLDKEFLRYSSWVRSTYASVVDALSGERLDLMTHCVKLRVEHSSAAAPDADAFEHRARAV